MYNTTRLFIDCEQQLGDLVSYTFGEDVVMEAVKRLDIDLVARAHQVVQVDNRNSFIFNRFHRKVDS